LAASTDISKVVRLEYGADELYTALAEEAIEGWKRWNRDLGERLYHETGLLFLRRSPLLPGTIEQDSFEVLSRRGHRPESVGAGEVRARFPAWNADLYAQGTYSRQGGFVESGRVIARLVEEARRSGVELREGVAFRELDRSGIVSAQGERIEAAQIVFALGAWTPHALPWLLPELHSTGHPVFHLAPRDPAAYAPHRFPVFCADVQPHGYYVFPIPPVSGLLKIGRHAAGRPMHPESPERSVTAGEIQHLRAFLAETFPGLRDAPIAATRI